jgi:OmpA-OmpF porin, OOP family
MTLTKKRRMTMKKALFVVTVILTALMTFTAAAQQDDVKNCKDHQLFPTRMPNYRIEACKIEDFGFYEFNMGKPPKTRLEGKFTSITYAFTGAKGTEPSALEVVRNYENAIKKVGGTIVFSDPRWFVTAKIAKDGGEAWVEAMKGNGKIWLKIVEKAAMTQHIEASAEIFSNDIRATGHAAVYGITFDTDSAAIKPESAQAIGEVVKLLKADPGLKIVVVGHTDNTGAAEHNLKLSQDRAQSVLQALVQGGIGAARLKSYGCGQYAPVASNDNEEGKAKNRRVELVKQ